MQPVMDAFMDLEWLPGAQNNLLELRLFGSFWRANCRGQSSKYLLFWNTFGNAFWACVGVILTEPIVEDRPLSTSSFGMPLSKSLQENHG